MVFAVMKGKGEKDVNIKMTEIITVDLRGQGCSEIVCLLVKGRLFISCLILSSSHTIRGKYGIIELLHVDVHECNFLELTSLSTRGDT